MRIRIRREIDSAIFNRYHRNSSAGHGQGGEEGIEGSSLAVVDSLIRGVYVGLQSCHSLLSDAMTKVKAAKMLNFNSDVLFSKLIPQLSMDTKDLLWFVLIWGSIENVVTLVATRSRKLATLL